MDKITQRTCLSALMGLALTSTAFTQTFSGTFTEVNPAPYAGISSQFIASNLSLDGKTGTPWEGAMAFCLDYDGNSLSQDPGWSTPVDTFSGTTADIKTIEAWDRYATPQNVDVAVAQVAYTVDNYYYNTVLPGGDLERRAFALTLWEIIYDGGTANGLDVRNGNFSSASNPDPSRLAETWLGEIATAGVTADYQKQNDWRVLDDARVAYQDYILLSSTPVTVPEPSTGALASLAALALAFRRRR